MFTIKNNTITLTRGDTARISLSIKDDSGSDYDFSSDTVLFTVKKAETDSEIVLQKEVTNGIITINPSDTAELPFRKFVYDVQVTTAGGDVYTVIPPSTLSIEKEVTWG